MSLTAVHAHVDTHPLAPPTHKIHTIDKTPDLLQGVPCQSGCLQINSGQFNQKKTSDLWGSQTRGDASGMMPNLHVGSAPPWLCAQAHMSRLPLLGCRVLDLQHWPPEARHLHHGSEQETHCLAPAPAHPSQAQACYGESLWQSPGLPLCLSCHGGWEESLVSHSKSRTPRRGNSQTGQECSRSAGDQESPLEGLRGG